MIGNSIGSARLSISLLGAFQAALEGTPIDSFESVKSRGLLAYLVVEADRPHRRESLAGLFWPEMTERAARANLRRVLSNLRLAIGDHETEPPFLLVDRQTLKFNRESDYWLDVEILRAAPSVEEGRPSEIDLLEKAISVYQGAFLTGFSMPDSAAFESWLLGTREWLQRQAMAVLHRLVSHYERNGNYETALNYARRMIELEPFEEEAHRQLLSVLALSGQRNAAIGHFEALRRSLLDELGVEPSPETSALHERIRAGKLRRDETPLHGRTVRGYQLRGHLGEGRFGAVYRAYQPVVGREVAVKIILPQYANLPDFIRRFDVEAQLVARLEHPHIVPLYDYWREPDGAYLVMRLLKAGSLKSALVQGPWKSEPAARLVDQIAAALTMSHRQGVVHRDIKPANILLDEEGNGYLSDFGIATLTGPLAPADHREKVAPEGDLLSTPEYLAPELAQGQTSSHLADIYSLGVVLYELVTGEHPFPGLTQEKTLEKHLHEPLPPVTDVRPDLRPDVDNVIQTATAKRPTQRYKDAMALADAFRQAIMVGVPETLAAPGKHIEIRNPFKGLRHFQEADAVDFFGREALTRQIIGKLAEESESARFLAMVGPSGSGKSSVVKAGLVPALRKGALPGSEGWFIVEMTPGLNPLEALETALLRIAVNPPPSLLEQLKASERGLLRAVKRTLPDDRAELVLIVDQFEELFTLVEEEATRKFFLDSLVNAINEPRSRLRVVVALRADFYDRPLRYPVFGQLVQARMITILPLAPHELEQTIVGPAEQAGLSPEPGLAATIVADLNEQPGALPLLQYALTELFERREGAMLTQQSYEAIGGVAGALGQRAEALYQDLDEASQRMARQLFIQMVALGKENGNETAADMGRSVLRAELQKLQVADKMDGIHRLDSGAMEAVIDRFSQFRLLTLGYDPTTREPTVQVAHEALFREWDRLRRWLNENRNDIRLHNLLAQATAEWKRAGGESSYLLRGARLAQFEEWANVDAVALLQDEQQFLETSLAERQKRQAADEARRQQELDIARKLADAERKRAQDRTEAATRLRRRAILLGGALILALVLGLMAVLFANQSRQQARSASARELAAASLANLEVDPERSILLALHGADVTLSTEEIVLPEVVDALHRSVQASRLRFSVKGRSAVAYSPNGSLMATGNPDGTAIIWNADSGLENVVLKGHGDRVTDVAFSPDGKRLLTGSLDNTVREWDTATGAELRILKGHVAPVITVAYRPDGRLLASTGSDGTAKLWNAESGQEQLSIAHQGVPYDLEFSPDGTTMAVAESDTFAVRIRDTASAEERLTLRGHRASVVMVSYSPDGKHLATASVDSTAKLWDVETGEELMTFEGHRGPVFGVDFSPDGRLIVTASEDGTARVWSISDGRELVVLSGHTAGVPKAIFSPNGKYVATSSSDGTTRVWDVSQSGSREWLTLVGHDFVVFSVEYSPDGRRLVTAGIDGTSRVWDGETGEELLVLTGHSGPVYQAVFSHDGMRIATASADGTAMVWDAVTGDALLSIDGHDDVVAGVAFSPDSARLATASYDQTVKVWDASSGKELRTLTGHEDRLWRVTFSPDGTRLASTSWDDSVRIWDATTGDELLLLTNHSDAVNGLEFNTESSQLVTASDDGTAKVWDMETGDEVLSLEGHVGNVRNAAFGPNGRRIATAGFDAMARLWDTANGQELLELSGHSRGLQDVSFSPDGRRLATASIDGTVRIYLLSVQELIELARSRVTRSLTDKECRQYLHLDKCP